MTFDHERATPALKRICALAMSDALRLRHPMVGTEHFLAAIMGDEDNTACKVLTALGATGPAVLAQLLNLQIPLSWNKGPLDLAPMAEKTLRDAIQEADAMHSRWVGTEHLLLGITAQEQCAAVQMLEAVGVLWAPLRYHTMNVAVGIDHGN